MLNEGLSEKQVGLVSAMEISIATLRGLCKVFIGGWEEETPGTPAAVRGHRASPDSAAAMLQPWTLFGKYCVCLGSDHFLGILVDSKHDGDVFVYDHK